MEALNNTKLQASDKVILKALLNREISIGDFDEVTANKYQKMLEELSVATMTITELDIQVALMKFWIKFQDMHKELEIEKFVSIF